MARLFGSCFAGRLKAGAFYQADQLVVLLNEHLALGGYCNEPAYTMDHSLFFQLSKVVHHFVVRQPCEVLDVGRPCNFVVGSFIFDGTEDLEEEL